MRFWGAERRVIIQSNDCTHFAVPSNSQVIQIKCFPACRGMGESTLQERNPEFMNLGAYIDYMLPPSRREREKKPLFSSFVLSFVKDWLPGSGFHPFQIRKQRSKQVSQLVGGLQLNQTLFNFQSLSFNPGSNFLWSEIENTFTPVSHCLPFQAHARLLPCSNTVLHSCCVRHSFLHTVLSQPSALCIYLFQCCLIHFLTCYFY